MTVTVFANATLVLPTGCCRTVRSWSKTALESFALVRWTFALERSTWKEGIFCAWFRRCTRPRRRRADFMDGTAEAFHTVWQVPRAARHHESHAHQHGCDRDRNTTASCDCAANSYGDVSGGAKDCREPLLRAVFFAAGGGCHPDQEFQIPAPENAERFTKLAEVMPLVVTVARKSKTRSGWFAHTLPVGCDSMRGTATPRSRKWKPR